MMDQVFVNMLYLYMSFDATALLPALKPPNEYIPSLTRAIILRVLILVLGILGATAHDVIPSTPIAFVESPFTAVAIKGGGIG